MIPPRRILYKTKFYNDHLDGIAYQYPDWYNILYLWQSEYWAAEHSIRIGAWYFIPMKKENSVIDEEKQDLEMLENREDTPLRRKIIRFIDWVRRTTPRLLFITDVKSEKIMNKIRQHRMKYTSYYKETIGRYQKYNISFLLYVSAREFFKRRNIRVTGMPVYINEEECPVCGVKAKKYSVKIVYSDGVQHTVYIYKHYGKRKSNHYIRADGFIYSRLPRGRPASNRKEGKPK